MQAQIDHACGVVEHFSHLESCDGKIVTDTTGRVTGPHLHYEITIDGTYVDPNEAYGKDLCDPAVRKALIEDAQRQLQGRAGGGGGAGSTNNTPPPPQTTPPEKITHVPTGEPDPDTGVINTGPAYYYVEYDDGRVTREIDPTPSDNTIPILPPTTSDVVPLGGAGGEITGCATDTWKAMVNQAVMQTRRETMINQRFIAKPDSVFAYSCFSDTALNIGQTLGIFSESTLWADKQISILNGEYTTVHKEMGEWSLDGAITNAALAPYESHMYLFAHDYLGGMLEEGHQEEESEEEGHDHDENVQAWAPCDTMNRVWQMAKCMNLTDEPLFPRFEDLITNDPRKFPDSMQCNNSGITQGMIDIARGKALIREPINTHMDILVPDGGDCGTPIRTGITVERRRFTNSPISDSLQYPDGLCLKPACSYQNEGSGDGSCVAK